MRFRTTVYRRTRIELASISRRTRVALPTAVPNCHIISAKRSVQRPSAGARGAGCGGCGVGMGMTPVGGRGVEHTSGRTWVSQKNHQKSLKIEPKSIKNDQKRPKINEKSAMSTIAPTGHSNNRNKTVLHAACRGRAEAHAGWGVVGVGWVWVRVRWRVWGLSKVRVEVWVRWLGDQNPSEMLQK